MVSAWLGFLFFIFKAIIMGGSLFFLWQAFRKEVKKKKAAIYMAALGVVTLISYVIYSNPLLSRPYFAEAAAPGEEIIIPFTGDAPGVVPLAQGQGAFLDNVLILTIALACFFVGAVGAYLMKNHTASFRFSSCGFCALVIGVTFL